MAYFHNLYFVYKKSCVYIYIIILCECQDVLMLLKFLRFSRVIFLPLTIIYTSIMVMALLALN